MKITTYSLIFIPILLILLRIGISKESQKNFYSETLYNVEYDFAVKGDSTPYSVTTFFPENTIRQEVITEEFPGLVWEDGLNKKMAWKGESTENIELSYAFTFRGKRLKVHIDPALSMNDIQPDGITWISPTPFIQSNDFKIQRLSNVLAPDSINTLSEISSSFYDFVHKIPSSSTDELTDAVTALTQYEASCNGKSRLLVALFRAKGIPARMVGGIILEDITKKTSHAWVEAKLGNTWVPFDALNGHYAEIPANYLELYKGDEFLITRSKNIEFDYLYNIESERINHYPTFAAINLWDVLDKTGIPKKPLTFLLLLPLGAFLVSVFKNVVGLKTFGVFLPVLIAFAFMEMGTLIGLAYFTMIIVAIALMNFPLEKWRILHTPKISVMLTAVAIISIIALTIFFKTGWLDPTKALVFPIIIITMMAEKFARKVEEDSPKEALNVYLQTLIVTLVCVWVFSSTLIQNFLITFPEILFTIAALNLLLGRWIGLRFTEFSRFAALKGV